MAIARDNKAYNHGTSSGSPATLTYSYTTAGSNRGLYVGVLTSTSVATVSGVKYQGVSMTQVGFQNNSAASGINSYLFYLANPTIGANNVEVTTSAAANIEAFTISYNGVKQTGQPSASNGQDFGNSGTATGTQSITTVDANSWLVWLLYYADGVFTWTNATPQETSSTFFGGVLLDSNGPIASAGSTSVGWTSNEGSSYEQGILAAISPVPASQILKVSSVAQASISKVSSVANASAKKIVGVTNT